MPVDYCQPGRNVSDLLHLDPYSSCNMLEEEDAEKVEKELKAKARHAKLCKCSQILVSIFDLAHV